MGLTYDVITPLSKYIVEHSFMFHLVQKRNNRSKIATVSVENKVARCICLLHCP